MELLDFKERFRLLVLRCGEKGQKNIAAKWGIPWGTFRNYLAGQRLPSFDVLLQIQRATGCDLNWLVTGQGREPGEESAPVQAGASAQAIDLDLLTDAMTALETVSDEEGLKMTPREKAEKVALIYELEQEREGRLSAAAVRRLAKLA